jgi:O-antigen ligase
MGTIGHPNKTGDYLMISFFVFLSLRYPQKIWQRVLIGLVLVAGIFTTGSNAAILGCLVGGFVILAFRIAHSDGKSPLLLGLVTALLGGIACLVAIIVIVGVPPSVVDFTWGTFLQNSIARLLAGGPVAGRMRTWSLGLEAYLSHPLGIGPDAFSTWIGAGTIHNDYLSHLVERGPLGFIGLLLLVIEVLVCLSASMALTKGDPGRQFQVLALGAGFLGSMIVGMSHEVMHWRHHWLLITLIFAQNKLLRIRGADTNALVSARDMIPEYHHVQIPES